MSFSEDDEPKAKPEEKEKKDKAWDIGNIGMAGNDMMMIVVLLVGFFLFKDQIMGLFQGGGTSAPTGAPSTETESEPTAPAETKGKGGKKGGGRHKRGGRRGGKRKRGGKAAPTTTTTTTEEPAASNYVGIANA